MASSPSEQSSELERIRFASGYLGALLRRSENVRWLWGENRLKRRYPLPELYNELREIAFACADLESLFRAYRHFKQRHFLRIGGRDLLGWADMAETTAQLSDLASVALQVGLEVLCQRPAWWLEREDLSRLGKEGSLPLAVLGLGKLGGSELNYVSDVDLIFLGSMESDRVSGASVGSRQVLRRLCQTLSRLLADQVEGDRVFLVDMRLRPQGKDGELVASLEGALAHYQLRGQAWERQALLKARPVAGNRSLGNYFLQEIKPFVFRRFLDFQALDEIKSMRDRILAEIRSKSQAIRGNVKLGQGGIREIEFIVQSLQLIYGGRYRELEESNTLRVLDRLQSLQLLPAEVIVDLRQAYGFLRKVEHWIQLDANRQSSRIPQSEEDLRRLSLTLGYESSQEFLQALEARSAKVHEHFLGLFQSEPKPDSASERTGFAEDKTDRSGIQEQVRGLSKKVAGFESRFYQFLDSFFEAYPGQRDEALMDQMLGRVERFLVQAGTRPGLKKMINGLPVWLSGLLDGVARSAFIANLLTHQPGLVEALTETETESAADDKWRNRAESILAGCSTYEERVEWIRRIKNERILLLALSDLHGRMDHADLLEHLSQLAELVLQKTLQAVLEHIGQSPDLPLAVLALGKLGSRELGYFSDLDLMFVYDPGPQEDQDRIPESVVKTIQRFMRILSLPLQEGPGYEVDTKLRPTGNYGPLAVTRKSWERYYKEQADIWELQALLRLRAVAGDLRLGAELESRAGEICFQDRGAVRVWPRLCHLRQRMERERSQERSKALDLKLGYGGLADLEFLSQGGQLVHGHKKESLRSREGAEVLSRVLTEMGWGAETTNSLTSFFHVYRALLQRLQLFTNQSSSLISREQLRGLRDMGLWPAPGIGHGLETWADLVRMRRRIRYVWNATCSPYGGEK